MPVLKPYTFVAGTPARAAEVNADFDTLYTEVNSLESQIAEYDAQLTELENSKADLNGSYLNRFSVANPVTDYDAVNKQYLFNSISNSLPYIYGLGLTIAGNNTITVGAGQCYDSTYTQILSLASNTSKQNTTQSASTTYYVYIIGTDQGSSVDILITTSSSEPSLPTDYIYYRRIGSYVTNSSNVIENVTNTQLNQGTNTDLINQNETAIQTLIVPNYSRAYGIGQGWKATENVFLWHAGESDIGYSTITLNYNGAVKTFNTCYDSGDGQSAGSSQLYIRKDTVVTWRGGNIQAVPLS